MTPKVAQVAQGSPKLSKYYQHTETSVPHTRQYAFFPVVPFPIYVVIRFDTCVASGVEILVQSAVAVLAAGIRIYEI